MKLDENQKVKNVMTSFDNTGEYIYVLLENGSIYSGKNKLQLVPTELKFDQILRPMSPIYVTSEGKCYVIKNNSFVPLLSLDEFVIKKSYSSLRDAVGYMIDDQNRLIYHSLENTYILSLNDLDTIDIVNIPHIFHRDRIIFITRDLRIYSIIFKEQFEGSIEELKLF